MAVDPAPIGQETAALMEELERRFGDDASLGAFAIIAEVSVDGSGPDDPGWTEIIYACSDNRRWVQAGLFAQAGRSVWSSAQPPE